MLASRSEAQLRQQLRWKKSWLRESLEVCRYFWRKNPAAAAFTYASIAFPFMAPFVVLHAVLGRLLWGAASGLWLRCVTLQRWTWRPGKR